MTKRSEEHKYETSYHTTIANGAAAGDVLLTINADFEGQVSEIEIDGPDAQSYSIRVGDAEGNNGTVKKNYANVSSVDRGSFENPVVEWGGPSTIEVVCESAQSASDYSINVTSDKLSK